MVAAQSLRSVFRALVQMYIYFYCAKILLQYFKLSFRLNYSIVHFEPLHRLTAVPLPFQGRLTSSLDFGCITESFRGETFQGKLIGQFRRKKPPLKGRGCPVDTSQPKAEKRRPSRQARQVAFAHGSEQKPEGFNLSVFFENCVLILS